MEKKALASLRCKSSMQYVKLYIKLSKFFFFHFGISVSCRCFLKGLFMWDIVGVFQLSNGYLHLSELFLAVSC